MKNFWIKFFCYFMIVKYTMGYSCNTKIIVKDASECYENSFSTAIKKKCCFFEYKDKKLDDKIRKCYELTLEQFLDIDKTIEEINNKDKIKKVLKLECDKSSGLSFNYVLLALFVLYFF